MLGVLRSVGYVSDCFWVLRRKWVVLRGYIVVLELIVMVEGKFRLLIFKLLGRKFGR